MGKHVAFIIGARRGTPAEMMYEDVAPYVGRHLLYFGASVLDGSFPAGTLARYGDAWYEVDRRSKGRGYKYRLVQVEPPALDEITPKRWAEAQP